MSSNIANNFIIFTLGCKLNQYESESISYSLLSSKFNQVNDIQKADIVIINTCTVTAKADAKSRNTIRKIKRENPDCILIITGCMVNTAAEELVKIKDADILIDNKDKDKIPCILKTFNKANNITPLIYKSSDDGSFNFSSKHMSKHARAFLKIQDGCSNMCSYCIVPHTRGASRSRPLDDILNEIGELYANGYEEIVLTGINLASYKKDKYDFNSLLDLITDRFGQVRFRISSIEPEYVNEGFMKILKKDNICPHIHMPLQNGSDKILKLMNRKYLIEDFENKINQVRETRIDPFVSTDLILGFPEESDEDFEGTFKFIEKIDFSYIHLFGFSPRKGTPAFDYKHKVPERIRDERMAKVKELIARMNYNYRQLFIGKKLEIIIEKKYPGFYTGKSENYLNLKVITEKNIPSKKRFNVILERIEKDGNFCEIIDIL